MDGYRARAFPSVVSAKMDLSYKVDEGYSEDTRSQDDPDSPMRMESGEDMLPTQVTVDAVMALGDGEKSGKHCQLLPSILWLVGTLLTFVELAYNILRTLRVSSIASVVDRLWPLFHKDPINIFPAEIMSQIFSCLDPPMLLEASKTSRAWRERVLDSGLWKHKFKTEGWGLRMDEIERFENGYNQRAMGSRSPTTKVEGDSAQKLSKSLPRASRPIRQPSQNAQETNDQIKQELEDDAEMVDVDSASSERFRYEPAVASGLAEPSKTQGKQPWKEIKKEGPDSRESQKGSDPGKHHLTQPLMLYASPGQSRLNYHHVFKQKRKLEDNWNNGQYKSFQLPHRDHPEDAHTECVYTIQYYGKHLVSGSRDRTLRIWDIDAQRLIRKPLEGHTGSVLCLQFDDREEEDIIISGSSDTHVILWRFSTGEMIKQLTNAHRESVLNLKFDERFLVTCSKDKTIKIWNRHELRPGHKDYPIKGAPGGGQCPTYILDMNTIGNTLRNGRPDVEFQNHLLEPYTHLMTLDLHGAAVNAIQIYKDQLVSASGDRNLRIWNIHSGECSAKIEAHAKGIACVQYDGKRIVSGSSDNTIRIWDPASKTEVARLDGHTRLVRTIQAAFADCPGGREKLESEAIEVQRQWQAASIAGLIPPNSERRRHGNPGSRKPKDIKSVGAKIPPSGGGSRWGRIISGSYDETIIIWKKTDDDEWVIGQRLRQDDALRAAGPPLIPRSDAQAQAQAQAPPNPLNLPNPAPTPPTHQEAPRQHPFQAVGVQGPLPAHQMAQQMVQVGAAQQGSSTHQQSPNPNQPQNSTQTPWANSAYARRLLRAQQQANISGHSAGGPSNAPQDAGQAGNPPNPAHALPVPAPPPLYPHHAPRPGPPPNAAQVGQPNARVFKLQFDARRIICCSQDPKIVGWDFANGDEHIIECARFFAAPQ